jgi:hypothetical protein
MVYLLAALIALGATAWHHLIERDARRSRDLYLAALKASTDASELHLARLDTTIAILAAMRAENEAAAPAPRPSCGCDACVEREVARDVLAAQGPLAHRIVVAPHTMAHRPVGFAIVRWGSA